MMKTILLSAVLVFATSSRLLATETLVFDGGGYSIHVLVGGEEKPSVVQVRFSPPGEKPWVIVPRALLRIEEFDDARHILILRFTNKKEPDLPAAFSLVVRKENALLTIGREKISGSFDWME